MDGRETGHQSTCLRLVGEEGPMRGWGEAAKLDWSVGSRRVPGEVAWRLGPDAGVCLVPRVGEEGGQWTGGGVKCRKWMQAQRWREKHWPVPAASSKALSLWFPGNSLGWVRLGLAASHTCGLGKWLGQPGALKILTWRHSGAVGLGQGRTALSLRVSLGKGR